MEWLFKLLGLIMILCASSLAGFAKSMCLKQRYKTLCEIHRSMSDLKERIRVSSGEVERLVGLSFQNDIASFNRGSFKINAAGLEKGDISLLNDFFSNLGMSDAESECERTELYMSLVHKKCDEAEKKCGELCKLYDTLGILCGIFICIFFL